MPVRIVGHHRARPQLARGRCPAARCGPTSRRSRPAAIARAEGHQLDRVEPAPSRPMITGSAMCESVPVSPCPGKCFAVASIPWSWRPRTSAATMPATAAGSSPKERVLMIGLAGLLLTSATGANARWMPTARPSSAVMRPISYAMLSLPVGAHAHIGGQRGAAVEPDAGAALEVRGDQQRQRASAPAAG